MTNREIYPSQSCGHMVKNIYIVSTQACFRYLDAPALVQKQKWEQEKSASWLTRFVAQSPFCVSKPIVVKPCMKERNICHLRKFDEVSKIGNLSRLLYFNV